MSKTLKRPEVLSPAGTLEKLKVAIDYGADAVFVGGQAYGLRSRAGNFSMEQMREGIEYAHARGAKVYVATDRGGKMQTLYMGSTESAHHGVAYDQIASDEYKRRVGEKPSRTSMRKDAELVSERKKGRTQLSMLALTMKT